MFFSHLKMGHKGTSHLRGYIPLVKPQSWNGSFPTANASIFSGANWRDLFPTKTRPLVIPLKKGEKDIGEIPLKWWREFSFRNYSRNSNWLVPSDEHMGKTWPFSFLNDEQMSNWALRTCQVICPESFDMPKSDHILHSPWNFFSKLLFLGREDIFFKKTYWLRFSRYLNRKATTLPTVVVLLCNNIPSECVRPLHEIQPQ